MLGYPTPYGEGYAMLGVVAAGIVYPAVVVKGVIGPYAPVHHHLGNHGNHLHLQPQ